MKPTEIDHDRRRKFIGFDAHMRKCAYRSRTFDEMVKKFREDYPKQEACGDVETY